MFKIGDKVVSMANGICTITDVVEKDMTGNGMKSYFILVPDGENNTKLFIPVDAAEERIRKTISKKEAQQVIDHILELDDLEIENEKDRELKYKEALRSGDPVKLATSLKSIYFRRKQRASEGKKSTVMDDKYYKLSVHKLHSELAYALGCNEADIMDMIHQRIE